MTSGRRVPAARRSATATAGPRARETQQRILGSIRDLLTSSTFRSLTVADVARILGTSSGTFYHYFPDIETAVLTLAEQMADEGAYLRDLVRDADWRADDGRPAAERLVNGFLDFWRKHGPLLNVMDLATLEGDLRFSNVRVRMLNAVTVALADVMDDLARDRGARSTSHVHSLAIAGALVGMLAHNSAYQSGYRLWQISIDELRAAMVGIVRAAIASYGDDAAIRPPMTPARASRRKAREGVAAVPRQIET